MGSFSFSRETPASVKLDGGWILPHGCGAMGKLIDPVGGRYGRLVVLQEIERKGKHRRFLCWCDCGAEKEVALKSLRKGSTQSCGCLHRDRAAARQSKGTHGRHWRDHPLYELWRGMVKRTTCKGSPAYRNYGGRGIRVCDRWRTSFDAFVEDMGQRPHGLTLDRIDNDGAYCPENCQWSDRVAQANNTRKNHMVSFEGRTLSISQWGRETGLGSKNIGARLRRGWSVEKALTTPVKLR